MLLPFTLSAQDCEIILPQDTFLCGFSQEFLIQPEGGVWSFDCGASPNGQEQMVSITNLGNGFCAFNFNSCGIYELVYTYEEPGCIAVDTFTVYVDDPSASSQTIDFDNSLEYADYSCHSGGSAECTNMLSIGGQSPPSPVWGICGDGSCSATIYTPIVTPDPNDPCIAFDVDIQSVSTGSSFSSCWEGVQDSFILVDTETGEVLSNEFLAYLDSLGLADILLNLTDCSIIDFSCFTVGEECIDSIRQDTSELLIPVHLGGNWNLLLAQDTIRMMDTTAFSYFSDDYLLIIEPGADYYGPDNIDLSIYQLVNGGNDTIMPSDYISFQMQWTEDWIYDTLEIIHPEIVYKDSLGCQTCGGHSSGSFFNVPEIPSFDCGPIGISFDFTCACMPFEIWASASSINCLDCAHLSANSSDFGVTYTWYGPEANGVQGSNISGICTPGLYTVIGINSYGCEATTSISVVEDFNQVYVDISPPDVISTSNPCVSLNGSATSDFPTNLNISWTGPNGFSSNDLNPSVCEPGQYTLYALDPWSFCDDQFTVTVEEMIVVVEEITAEICSDECFEIDDQEYCESGFYVYQASPSLIYEINLTVYEIPEIEILTPAVITESQGCVELMIQGSGTTDMSSLQYIWSGPNGFSSNDMFITVCEEGEYTLTAEEQSFACAISKNIAVFRYAETIAEICAGDCYDFEGESYCDADVYAVQVNPYYTHALQLSTQALTEKYIDERLCPGESIVIYGEEYTEAGLYEIIIPGLDVCDTIVEFELFAYPNLPNVEDQIIETCIVDGLTIENTVSIGEDLIYMWKDGVEGESRTIDKPGIYELDIISECEIRTQRFEIIETVEDFEDAVYIPNIFSPNQDGLNDEFIVQSGVELLDLKVQIFDRWGSSMFYSEDVLIGWDGTFKERAVPSNSYVYVVEYSTQSCDERLHKKLKSGTITLMR